VQACRVKRQGQSAPSLLPAQGYPRRCISKHKETLIEPGHRIVITERKVEESKHFYGRLFGCGDLLDDWFVLLQLGE